MSETNGNKITNKSTPIYVDSKEDTLVQDKFFPELNHKKYRSKYTELSSIRLITLRELGFKKSSEALESGYILARESVRTGFGGYPGLWIAPSQKNLIEKALFCINEIRAKRDYRAKARAEKRETRLQHQKETWKSLKPILKASKINLTDPPNSYLSKDLNLKDLFLIHQKVEKLEERSTKSSLEAKNKSFVKYSLDTMNWLKLIKISVSYEVNANLWNKDGLLLKKIILSFDAILSHLLEIEFKKPISLLEENQKRLQEQHRLTPQEQIDINTELKTIPRISFELNIDKSSPLKGVNSQISTVHEKKSSIDSNTTFSVQSTNSIDLSEIFESIVRKIHYRRITRSKLKSIRNYPEVFIRNRKFKRQIIFNVGPTNSGKTHAAIENLKSCKKGIYLAPLRLLAHEVRENLILKSNDGVIKRNCNLITGEQKIQFPSCFLTSATIECVNLKETYDVAVIDEIQLINDQNRSWAYLQALCGVNAKTVYLTGSAEVLNIVKYIVGSMGDSFQYQAFTRLNNLELMNPLPLDINQVTNRSAIIAFSRRSVLSIRDFFIRKNRKVSCLYGKLSPQTRLEEARKFKDGETEILVATDAIGMGLNLPIETILFAEMTKFDGKTRRTLKSSEILQIAGRAGRYGLHRNGFVGSIEQSTNSQERKKLKNVLVHSKGSRQKNYFITNELKQKPKILALPSQMHFEQMAKEYGLGFLDALLNAMDFFSFENQWIMVSHDALNELLIKARDLEEKYSSILSKNEDPDKIWKLVTAPVATKETLAYNHYLKLVDYLLLDNLNESKNYLYYEAFQVDSKNIDQAEDAVRINCLYLWFANSFPSTFLDREDALENNELLSQYISEALSSNDFMNRCPSCKKRLPLFWRHRICNRCYVRRSYYY